jgi:DNA polymerase
MDNLHIDYETRSPLDLSIVGLDRYLSCPDTEIILMAYTFNDEPVDIWQPHKEVFPLKVAKAFNDNSVILRAWHAAFERNASDFLLGYSTFIRRWRDSMVLARYMALPGGLDECGEILKIPREFRKMENSNPLKDMFCLPTKPGGEETLFGISKPIYRDWNSNPVEWEQFVEYCKQDVVSERAIENRLKNFPVPDSEWEAWFLDQEINERGIMTDTVLVDGGSYIAQTIKDEYTKQLFDITKLENPNSRDQMLSWLRNRNYPFHELGKAFVARALAEKNDMTEEARLVLKIRQQSSKTSSQKLINIKEQLSSDGRLRFMFNFFGASRTGRWTSGGTE